MRKGWGVVVGCISCDTMAEGWGEVGGGTAGSQLSNVLPTKSVFFHKEWQKNQNQKEKQNKTKLKCPTKFAATGQL